MALIAKHLTISGRVQGVWYRAWATETAQGLALTGWVRNRSDGAVEAVVQGPESAVEQFIARAWEGPAAARVDMIDIADEPVSDMHGFKQRATA